MKKVSLFGSTTLASIAAATVIAAPVFACHPVGSIVKTVQDQTTGSTTADANDQSSALTVNNGDTLIYTITVKNTGAAAGNGDNDMLNVAATDNLPAGLQIVSTDGSTSMGTIKPGQSMTVKYTVKVSDTTDGDVIANKACYAGKSKDNNNNQSGCDYAYVKVHVPVTPAVTPTPTPTPQPQPQPQPAPAAMPDTGSTALSTGLFAGGAAVFGYVLNALRLKFRDKA